MKIDKIRIYAEVLEQGLDFKNYIIENGYKGDIENIYTKKIKKGYSKNDILVDRIRKSKDIDILITAISEDVEYPILMVEYSTAVPTDDHKMQRSDVCYWGAFFKIPVMKISPLDKGMDIEFGGGDKLTDKFEIALAYKNNAVFYPIIWDREKDKDVLKVKENKLSCISHNTEIAYILKMVLSYFKKTKNFQDYYEALLKDYKKQNEDIIKKYTDEKIKSQIANSSRFKWIDDRLIVKINRFGHAMDPERGILYFINMLIGAENIISEIQVNRSPEYKSRGGYSALFDRVSREQMLKKYVEDIIENKDNVFTEADALYVFCTALNIDDALCFDKISKKSYFIEDDILLNFLLSHPSMTAKSIFFLSTELRLTDRNREIICTVRWNKEVIDRFIKKIASVNYGITKIVPLSMGNANEDIITFASVQIYKKLKYELLAVSYPGAQGDRCILTDNGRKVLRTYVDIIAYKNSKEGMNVYLQENKKDFLSTVRDIEKLQKLIKNKKKLKGLRELFKKNTGKENFACIYTAVGARKRPKMPNLDADYIFMFDIDKDKNELVTNINYSVAIINTKLIDEFKPLINSEGKLQGTLELDKIYIIKDK